MINTYVEPVDPLVKAFMPKKRSDDVKTGEYFCERSISLREIEDYWKTSTVDLAQMMWDRLYEQAIRHVTNIIVGRDEYFVVRYIPMILSQPFDYYVSFRVSFEIFVAQSKNMTILLPPTFVYSPVTGQIKEWRCGHCQSPNEMSARHCTQCGAPRAKLIQEM